MNLPYIFTIFFFVLLFKLQKLENETIQRAEVKQVDV